MLGCWVVYIAMDCFGRWNDLLVKSSVQWSQSLWMLSQFPPKRSKFGLGSFSHRQITSLLPSQVPSPLILTDDVYSSSANRLEGVAKNHVATMVSNDTTPSNGFPWLSQSPVSATRWQHLLRGAILRPTTIATIFLNPSSILPKN